MLTHRVNDNELQLEIDPGDSPLPRYGTLTEFSGDGKWPLVEQAQVLYGIPAQVEGTDSNSPWYNEFIDPR